VSAFFLSVGLQSGKDEVTVTFWQISASELFLCECKRSPVFAQQTKCIGSALINAMLFSGKTTSQRALPIWDSDLNTQFLWSNWVTNKMHIPIGSAVFAGIYPTMEHSIYSSPAKKSPFRGDLGPHIIHGFLGLFTVHKPHLNRLSHFIAE